MRGLGDRMRARARELGMSDAEVARRTGLTQQRYANYVADRHEPDLETFSRICSVLQSTADSMLGEPAFEPPPPDLVAAIATLDREAMAVLAVVADALALRTSSSGARPAVTREEEAGIP